MPRRAVVGFQRGRHRALEEIAGRQPALSGRADRNHFRVQRGRNQAPFCSRVGVRKAAAEGAADADRVMRNMPCHAGQHRPQRASNYGAIEGGVPHSRANAQHAILRGKPVQPGDGVDVDQISRPREAKIHDRDEALPTSQHTAVLRRKFSEELHRLLQRFRAAIGERRGFHRRTIADAVARVR